MSPRALFAEFLGTALLVFFGAGTAMLTFGFKIAGMSGSAGVVATAMAFGLVLLVLVYTVGPISGCHVNPAVTISFLVARRISLGDAIGYWVAQFVGAIGGAALLYGIAEGTPNYSVSTIGLGADGYGKHSMVGLNWSGTFGAEIVLTFVFALVVLTVTRRSSNAAVAGLVIGFALMLIHVMSIPLDGTSVNPARSLGPALFVGHYALSQLWVFIVAPLIGGALAAIVHLLLYPKGKEEGTIEPAPEVQTK